ncbi:MAG: toxin-antitoxin system YwqK family antitoxin [Bacteroidota bacterium]
MKQILTLSFFLWGFPLLVSAQTKNQTDSQGRKQGVHDGYSGSWLFERTYVNDTLNGPFRQYTKDGTTWATGYFLNGLKDSVWLDFYPNKKIKEKAVYRKGKKEGAFVHYFENGDISYTATFKNDSLYGDAIGYYPSLSLESKGDPYNGEWIEYYENGNIKSKQSFTNRILSSERFYFSAKGDTLLPRNIAPQPVLEDTSIINQTTLKVYLLFNSFDSLNKPIDFGPHLFHPIPVCKNEQVVIHIGPINFLLTQNGFRVYEQFDPSCLQKIKTNGYTTNRDTRELPNGNYDVRYALETKLFKSRLGKIAVERKQMQCDDTGNNPLTITRDNKTLLFKDIGNVLFFEFDSDNDTQNELYVLNYFSCEKQLKIYKVDDK